ncbi:hypothetical protein DXT69_27500 [Escherichia coli]|nr:hypothetical protein DXT69_27500 [Escherichia coli]
MTEFLCAVGVVPTRVYPKSGRISALAGREGRLRACTENFQQGYNPRRYWSRKNLGFRLGTPHRWLHGNTQNIRRRHVAST